MPHPPTPDNPTVHPPTRSRKARTPPKRTSKGRQPASGRRARPTRRRQLALLLSSTSFRGYAVSLLLHSTLMIAFSVAVVEGMTGNDDFSTLMTQSEGGEADLEQIDTRMQVETESLEPRELPQFRPVESQVRRLPPPDLAEKLQSRVASRLKLETRDGEADRGRLGDETGYKMTGNAVTKGSFTAWTVPEDPDENQFYLIVIQIAVPEHVRRYPVRDLSGIVVGTDGYRQPIPGRRSGFLPRNEDYAQLVIGVPGAPRLPDGRRVRDTIRIHSKILDERQTLEIEF